MKKIDEIIEEFDNKFQSVDGEDFQGWIVGEGEKRVAPYNEDPDGLLTVKSFLRQVITDYKEETLKLITEEIAQAQIEGTPTSRLTSLYNNIK